VINELGAVVMSLESEKCLHSPAKHPKREMEAKSDRTTMSVTSVKVSSLE